MEDAFQRLARLVRRGSESRVISLERMFQKMIKTMPITFPNVGQTSIAAKDLEETSGHGRFHKACANVIAPLHRGRLAKAAFSPDPHKSWLKKPTGNHKTCKASAFSQQVGLEECLLQSQLAVHRGGAAHGAVVDNAFFTDLRFMTKSWACGFVETVAETATNLLTPYVLARESTASLWLVVCSLGRCLLGWPLRLVEEGSAFFQPVLPMTRSKLERIIVTDPFTTADFANVPVEVSFVNGQVGYIVTGPPRSVVEAAAVKGFTKVACKTVLDFCLKSLNLRVPSQPDQKVGRLIEALRDSWGWSKADVAKAMVHVLAGAKNGGILPTKEARGPEVPQDVLDLAEALHASEESRQGQDVQEPSEELVEVPGIGPVNAALLHALAGPEPSSAPGKHHSTKCQNCSDD